MIDLLSSAKIAMLVLLDTYIQFQNKTQIADKFLLGILIIDAAMSC